MRRWSGTCLGIVVAAAMLTSPTAEADEQLNHGAQPLTLALIGDTPYGDTQEQQFPALVHTVNADPRVRMVLHAGDVKSGSSTCDDARFERLAELFDTFRDPFVLTPGDNEWTDCHRTAAGQYLPTERLEAVRRVFFRKPGQTLGRRTMTVATQADDPAHAAYRENMLFTRSRVVFATVHVVGSRNDLAPWDQLPGGDRPDLRLAEFAAREAAALAWIDRAFDTAEQRDAAGVLLLMQAEPIAGEGFQAIRDRITARAAGFGRPVLLVHGDEHIYEVEPNYAGVANLTRLETFGDTATQWLRVTVDPRLGAVFSWTPQASRRACPDGPAVDIKASTPFCRAGFRRSGRVAA
jgi:Calcineurin-like phosphoesterase